MFETAAIPLLLIDATCVAFVGLPFFILTPQHKPFKRGFFCNDDSIRFPLKQDTISYQLLGGVMIPFTLIVIVCGECLSVYMSCVKNQKPWGPGIYLACIYKSVGCCLFGGLASQSLTDIAKATIGRLRPHFLAACRPVWDQINCKSGGYIENFTCTGDAEQVDEARLSFYSGHSSFSMYCMLFLVRVNGCHGCHDSSSSPLSVCGDGWFILGAMIAPQVCSPTQPESNQSDSGQLYIQARLKSEWARLLRPTIQFFLLATAIYVGLSRVSDYMHHWSDVLVGFIQGAIMAILTAVFVADSFKQPGFPEAVPENESSHTSLQESPSIGNHYGSTD